MPLKKSMDENTFIAMVTPISKKLYGFALRMLKNEADAQDAAQDVMVKLWTYRKKINIEKNLTSLAMTIMKNKCIDRIWQSVKIEHSTGIEAIEAKDNNYEHTDLIAAIKHKLDALPEQQKMIIELKDFQGYDNKEISEIMGISVNSIRVNLSRARKKLLAEFNDILI